VELAGREEVEVPELLGGVEEVERREETEVESGVLSGRELAPWICCMIASEKVPVMPVILNFAENAKAGC